MAPPSAGSGTFRPLPVDPEAARVLSIRPSADLAPYVRSFDYVAWSAVPEFWQPVAACPFPALAFFLESPCVAYEFRSQAARALARTVVTGPLTHRVANISASGPFVSLAVRFQPLGLSRLFGIPAGTVTDYSWDARDVLGTWIDDVHDRLRDTPSLSARLHTLEAVLREKLAADNGLELPDGAGQDPWAWLRSLGLGERQARRRFVELTGMGPRHFACVLRFSNALGMKSRQPDRLWTDIALDADYYDSSHMNAEFRQLAGACAGRFWSELQQAPRLRPVAFVPQPVPLED